MPNQNRNNAENCDIRFRSLYENSFDAVLLTKPDGSILSANPAACEMFGMTENELQKAKRNDLVVVDQRVNSILEQRKNTGKSRAELTLKRKDGSTFEGEVTSSLFTDSDGIVKTSMIIRDITKRKKAEEKLRTSEERYKSLFEQAADYILVLELPKVGVPIIRDANEAALKMHGYTREEFINQSISIIDKRIDDAQTKWLIDSVSGGKVVVFEVEHYRKDGTFFTAEVAVKAVKLGSETWILSVERDITQRKKTQEELIAAEIKYRTIFEQAGDYILILEAAPSKIPIIYDANDYALQIHGYTREELIGKPITFLDRCMSQKEHEESDARMFKGEKVSFETEHFRKDGTKFTVEVINKLVKIGNKQFIIAIERDVTERKKLEEQLKISSNIFDVATDSIIVIDLDGNLVSFNEATYKQRGYSKEEMAKLTLYDLAAPESAALIKTRVTELLQKGSLVFEEVELTKTKRKMSVEVNARVIESNGKTLILGVIRDISERKKVEEKLRQTDLIFENSLDMICMAGFDGYFKVLNPAWSKTLGWSTEELLSKPWLEFVHPKDQNSTVNARTSLVNGQKVFQFENRYRCKDGTFVWLSWNSIPFEQEQRIFAVARNITDKKEADDRIAIANEKLRVTGSLTRHDVRNKLSVIKTNVYLLKKRLGENPELKKYLQGIDDAVEASNKLFEFSTMYEKIGVEKPSEIDIGIYFQQAADLLQNNNIKIVNECKGLVVTADTLIRQLFYNLLDNSSKHGKTVTEAMLYFNEKDNDIELIYQDNGAGIPQEIKPKIFLEGFTTSNGSGLGLMLAKKMVEAYGWSITESGESGKGAKFVITIPKIRVQKRLAT